RSLCGDRAAEAQRGNPSGAAWPDSRGSLGQAANGAEAADQERSKAVREAEGNHRADLRSVEARAGLPAILAEGSGGDALGVEVDVRGAQSAEGVAAQPGASGGVIDLARPAESSVGDGMRVA